MEKLVYFGKYRHFKGNEYRVIKEIELEGEIFVLYQKLYGDFSYWLRPKKMFLDYKDCLKRFTFTGDVFVHTELPKRIEAKHSETEKIYEIIL